MGAGVTTGARNWRRVKEDISFEAHILAMWRAQRMDTKDIASILKIRESRVYNILSRRKRPFHKAPYAGAE